jgi:hypothetical protein
LRQRHAHAEEYGLMPRAALSERLKLPLRNS